MAKQQQNPKTEPNPVREGFSKGNTKPTTNTGRQAPPPPKPPSPPKR